MKNTRYVIQDIRYGFTLIEVLIAVIFVGLAIAALVGANSAFTKANGTGTELSTSEFLLEQIRELTAMTDYDNLAALDNTTYCPPINAISEQLTEFSAFSQQVVVENVSASDFEQVVADGSSDFLRVTVDVYLNSKLITSTSWLRTKY